MRVVVQRVLKASVIVNEKEFNKIDQGYLLFVGLNKQDRLEDLDYCARKIAKLRIFSDDNDKLNLDINEINGEILSISQFTLYGNVRSQNRPSFTDAMEYNQAKLMYLKFNEILRKKYDLNVYDGIFGENMKILLVNDGPVTILIDTEK